jgi:hypothetical protein
MGWREGGQSSPICPAWPGILQPYIYGERCAFRTLRNRGHEGCTRPIRADETAAGVS